MKILIALFVLIFTASCQINPVTGDNNIKISTNEQAIQEAKIAYEYLLKSNHSNLDVDKLQYERVQRIFNTLLPYAKNVSSEAEHWDWELHVVKSGTVNAFCMAGGKIIVFSGLIEKLNLSDDALAHIMAHEISHALAGHVASAQSLKVLTDIGLIAAKSKYKNNPQTVNGIANLSNVLITLPFSRTQEDQADKIGLELMIRAGYKPEMSLEFFQKMVDMKGTQPIDFFNNHPSDSARIASLTKLIPELRNINPNQQTLSLVDDEFKKFSNGLIDFDCHIACSWAEGANRKQVMEYYNKQMWKELAVVIVKIGITKDLNYFYLAKAAEGLGYPKAARIYYKKALELSDTRSRCDVLFKYQCNGISVAQDSQAGLERLN